MIKRLRSVRPFVCALLALCPVLASFFKVITNSVFGKRYLVPCTLLLLLLSTQVHAQFTITENFKGNSTGNITTGGTAALTSGTADPVGNGWLRLTSDGNNQLGYGVVNQSFPSTLGVIIDFEYTTWRTKASGADGISVFLYDAATPTFSLGSRGGSLGYANSTATGNSGLSGGYIGIGLDEFGNYSSSNEGKDPGTFSGASVPNAVALRGPAPTYTLLATNDVTALGGVAYNTIVSSRPPATTFYRRVQMEITPVTSGPNAGKYTVTVKWKTSPNGAFATVLGPTVVATPPPANLKLGFAASTGGSVNYHEIRNLIITTPGGVRVDKTVDKSSALIGDQVTYTVNAYNSTPAAITGLVLADTIKNNDNTTVSIPTNFTINSITFNNNGNAGNTSSGGYVSGVPKTTGFTNPFSVNLAMAANSMSTFTIVGTINTLPTGGVLKNSTGVDPSATGITDTDLTNNYFTTTTNVLSPNVDFTILKSLDNSCGISGTSNTYTILVSNNGATSSVAGQTVTVTDAIPAGSVVSSASGSGWTITNSGNTYTFKRTNALASGFAYPAITIVATPPTSGTSWTNTATVAYTGVESNTANNSSSVTLYAKPAAPTVTSPVVYCQGATATALTATGTNLLWYTVAAGGTGSATAPIPSTSTAGSTTYYVSQSNGTCESALTPITVTVQPSISNNTIAAAQAICPGTTPAALTGSTPTGGSGTYTYLWEQSTDNGTTWATAGGTSNTIGYTPGVLNSTTLYRRTVTSGSCSSVSATVTITVQAPIVGNTITNTPPVTVCSGSPVPQLTGSTPTGGSGTYTYQWQVSTTSATAGFAAAAGTNNAINYTSAALTATSWFRRVVTSGTCTDTSPALQVTVNAVPTTSVAGPNQGLCQVTSTTLAGNAATVGTGAWSQLSGPNTAVITNPALNNTTVTGLIPGVYVFTWTISNGVCTPSASNVQVTINATPRAANAGPNQTLCNATSTTLAGNASVAAGDGTGAWSQVSGPNTATITNPALNNTGITGFVAGTYVFRWTISNGACTPTTADVTITINPAIATNTITSGSATVCSGATVSQLTGSQPTGDLPNRYTYLWESSTTSATTGFTAATGTNNTINYNSGALTTTTWFRRTVYLGACTDISPAVQITVSPTPTTSNAGPNQALCQVSSITLAGNTTTAGTGAWSQISGPNTGSITSPTQGNSTVTGLVPGVYVFRWSITSGVCPPSTSDVQITIYANPRTANAGPNQTLCNVTSTTLAGNASVTAGDGTGVWTQVSGPNTATITNPAQNNTTVTGMVTGNYVFRWTVSNGVCTPSTSDVTISNQALPTTSNAGPNQTQNNSGVFTMQGNAPTVGTGTWTVKAGSTATIADPTNKNTTVTIAPNTTATLVWTITNAPCASSSSEVTISYVSQADIKVVKTVVDPGPYVAGAPITYKIVVTNNGPSDATAIKIIDAIPADFIVSNIGASASGVAAVVQNTSTGNNVNVVADISVGAANMITIIAKGIINPSYAGTLTNTAATFSFNVPDPNGPKTSTVTTPVTRNPQLNVVKQGPSNAVAGQAIAYKITVSNQGTGDAIGTAITDAIPSQITGVTWALSKTGAATFTGSATGTGNNINITGTIPAGSGNTIVIDVSGTVSSSATGSFTNTATATPAEPGVAPVNSNTVTTNLSSKSGVVMLKNGPATGQAGATLSYTLQITNSGPSDAVNASITDAVPATLKNVSWSATVQGGATVGTASGTGNAINLSGNIPAGAANVINVTITGTVDPAFSGVMTNTATVTPSEAGGTASSSTVNTTIGRTPVVSITKTGPATLKAGQTIMYTIEATNTGLSNAKSLVINDTVPAEVTNVSWSASVSGSASVVTTTGTGNAISVNGDLPAGAGNKITITVTGMVNPSFDGTLLNSVTATPAEPGTSAKTATSTTTVKRVPALAIQKTGPATITSGQQVTYTVEVTNTGSSDSDLASIVDAVPTSLSNVSWSTAVQGSAIVHSGGTGANSNNISVSVDVPAGAANKVIVTIKGTLDPSFSGTLSNTATVTASETGTSVSSTTNATASRIPDITLTKSGPAAIVSGQQITYTIEATNLSTSDAKSLKITDNVPAQISNVSWTASAAGAATIVAPLSGTGNAISITGDLPAGAANKMTIIVTGTVDPAFAGSISNLATATPAEPGTATRTATTVVTVSKTPTVSIQKSGPSAVSAGQQITYTLVINNTGTANADVVNILDNIPASVTNVKWTSSIAGAATITSGGTGTGNTVAATANIPAGAANIVTVTITGTVDPAFTGNIVNTANATPQGQPSVPSNTVTIAVSNDPTIDVQKSAPANISAGGQITYTILVDNNGPSNATGVAIVDQIPATVLNPTWTATATGTGTSVSLASGTGNVNITGNIPAGAGHLITVTVTGQVDPAFVGSLLNHVTATAPGKTPVAADATTNVTNDPNVQITKSGPAALSAGQNISYTLTVTNNGSSNANNVAIADAIPAGIQNATWTATVAGTATVVAPSGTGNVNVTGNIPAGAANSITITINGKVDPSFAPGNLVNTATATPAGKPVVTSNPVTTVITSDPSIMVVKSGPDNASAGTQVTYTITVTNTGVSDASNVAISDPLPTGLTNVTWTAVATGTGATVSAPSGVGAVNITGNLPAGTGRAITITYKGTIDPAFTGTLTNTATGTAPGKTPATGSKTTTVTNDPVIVINKTGPSTIAAGQAITYTLVINNTGPSNASNVAIADNIPAGLTNVSWTAVASGAGTTVSATNGTGNVALSGNIPTGTGNVTVTIKGTVDPAFTGGSILNTAMATAPGKPTVSSNVTTTITKVSDLQIVKSGPQAIVAGQQVSYTITVTNAGPSNAVGASISDILPASLLNASWTVSTTGAGTTASAASGTGNVNITGTIPAGTGNSIVIALTAKLDPSTSSGSISNTATATPPVGTTDPTPATSTVTSTISKQADLVIVKSGPADRAAGQAIQYQLVITNDGPSDVIGATILDNVPSSILTAGLTYTTSTTGTAAVTSPATNGNRAMSIIGNIPAGAGNSIIVNISGTVDPTATGTMSNTATVNVPAGITETVPATNTSTITTNINTSVGVQISKSGPAIANIGDMITYRIEVSNNGLSDAAGVSINDVVPPEIANVSWTAQAIGNGGTTVNATSGIGNNISLTANVEGTTSGPGTIVLIITGKISPIAGASITNTATATFGGDKTSTFTTSVNNAADLRILKAGPAAISAGQKITYTIDVTNAGPASVTGATIADNVPAAIQNVSWSAVASGGASIVPTAGTGNVINLNTANIPVSTGAIKLTVTGTVDPAYVGGPLVNTATATPPAGNPDPTPATSTTSTIVNTQPGIQVVKSGPSSIPAGEPISYTVVVTNSGPSNASNISITDILPAGILNPTWTAVANGAGASVTAGATGSASTINVTGNLVAGAGNEIRITINGTVDPDQTASLVNKATATPSGGTPVDSPPVTTVVTNQTGLQIVKSGPATIAAGQAITYTVVVANNGPSNAKNLSISDLVPNQVQGVTWAAVANGAAGTNIIGTAIGSTNTVSLNANIIAGTGNNITITINGTVDPNYAGTLVNTATATPSGGIAVSSVVNTTVSNTPGLRVVKSGPSSINAGQGIVYTVEVTNMGPSNATNVTITDVVPAKVQGVTWTAVATGTGASITNPVGASGAGNNISLTGNIAADPANKITLTIKGTVDPAFTGLITNQATATPAGGTAVPSTPIDTKVNNTPGLHITKSAPSAALANEHITYTVVVSNSGPSNAVGSVITDAVPAGINNVSWKATASGAAGVTAGGTGTGSNVSVTGDIPAGANNFITILIDGTIAPNFSGTLSNVATVTPPGGTPVTTDPSTTVVQRSSDIQIEKSGPSSIAAGANITYTIDVSNAGPSDADLVTIADVVPSDILVKDWSVATISGTSTVFGAASGNGNNINVQASLSNGGQLRITVHGTVKQTTATSLVNTATATLPAGVVDPTPNNTSTVTTTIVQQSGVRVTKTGPQAVHAGEAITYVVEAINVGPSDAKGVNITDVVPPQVTNVSWTTKTSGTGVVTTGTNGSGNNILVVGDIPNGAANKITITLTGKVDPNFLGTINNFATGSVPSEPNSTNQITPTVVTTVDQKPVIVITKTGPSTLVAGAPITYVIEASNTGLSNAKGLVITDQVPVQVKVVKWTATSTGAAAVSAGGNGTGNAVSVTGDIPAGAGNKISITVTGTVDPTYGGTISNAATATPAEPGNPPVVSPPVTTNITQQPIIVLTKSGPATISAGNKISYVITATNNGLSDAKGLVITDNIDPNISGTSWTATSTGTAAITVGMTGTGNAVSLTGNIPAGTGNAINITVTGTVNPSFVGTINNTATGTPAEPGNPPVVTPPVTTTVSAMPTVTITKTGPATITAGNQITYVLTVGNTGPSDAKSLAITDNVDTRISNVTWTTTSTGGATINGTTGTGTGNAVTVNANIPAGTGNQIVVTIKGTVLSATTGSISNVATATPNEPGTTPVVTPPVVTPVTLTPTVTITKTGPATITAGNQITYVLTVGNTGPSDARNLAITDNVDANISNVTWTATGSGGATVNGTTGTGTGNAVAVNANIPAGAGNQVIVTIKGTVSASATGKISNVATATPNEPGTTPVVTPPVVTPVTATPTVTITKTGPATITAGNQITYVLTVGNTGPSDARNLAITDNVDANIGNVTWTTTSSGGATVNGTTGTGTGNAVTVNANIPAGAGNQVIVTIKGTVSPSFAGSISNIATATPAEPGTTPVVTPPVVTTSSSMPGVNITKTGPANVTAGNQITYVVTVGNNGPSNAKNLAITDMIDANISNVSWTATASGGSVLNSGATGTGNAVNVNANIPAGANNKVTVTITGTVLASSMGTISNIATATPSEPGVPPVVSPAVVTTVKKSPGVMITKTGPSSVKSGDRITYVVEISNSGPSNAQGLRITDDVPISINNVSWTTTTTGNANVVLGGTGTGSQVAVTADIQAGNANKVVLTITGTVSKSFTGTISNKATATPSEIGIPAVSSATVETVVGDADFVIPNIITPNGDGKNDEFKIKGIENYPGTQVMIFNRWGNQVFRADSYQNNWDGSQLNEGTYYYIVNRREHSGAITTFKGWVFLKR